MYVYALPRLPYGIHPSNIRGEFSYNSPLILRECSERIDFKVSLRGSLLRLTRQSLVKITTSLRLPTSHTLAALAKSMHNGMFFKRVAPVMTRQRILNNPSTEGN